MAGLSQTQSLSQQQVLAPQLQQSLQILQAPMLELRNLIQQELCTNPTLEEEIMEPTIEDKKQEHDEFQEEFDRLAKLDEEWRDYMSQTQSYSGRSAEEEERRQFFFDSIVGQETLQQHLLEQVYSSDLSESDRKLAELVIGNIDDSGFLQTTPEDIANNTGMDLEDIKRVLDFVHTFHPVGVGARDLAECLTLQLQARDRFDPAMAALLTRLDLLARRDMAQLTALCGVDAEDITDMLGEIRTLNPKPGLAFGSEHVAPVVPDVFVRVGPDGGWLVELNSDTLPRLLVNSRYYSQVSKGARDKDAKTYLTDCLNNANWLVKSLDQRARTILKVSTEIVRQQDAFLTYGVRHLRPLNLRIIADAISMHESTVSRVTSNKYVSTPRGLFELKYFFTASIQSVNGAESHSAEAVRDRIREMIEKEAPLEILSDDRIVALLTADGVNIARRTVAKYREAMRIPSSVERRRLKAGDLQTAAFR